MTKAFANTKLKLVDIKSSLQLIASDYDGTLVDSDNAFYNHQRAKRLILKILKKYHCAIITARGASALKIIVPPLLQYTPFARRLFLGGTNGVLLYELYSDGIKEIYNHSLRLTETKSLLNIYKETCQNLEIRTSHLNLKGIQNFLKFLSWDWSGIISSRKFKLNKPFKGRLFIEDAKISLVLPKRTKQRKLLVNKLQENIGNAYTVVAGDKIYAHITKRLQKDSKLTVVNKLMEILNLQTINIATFGDMPEDNDKELLSLPFSFTNDRKLMKSKSDYSKPPYILPCTYHSPVESIHKAINDLIK